MGELIGYARCPAIQQDLTAQREILTGLGVPDDRIYPGKGLTGTSRAPAPILVSSRIQLSPVLCPGGPAGDAVWSPRV